MYYTIALVTTTLVQELFAMAGGGGSSSGGGGGGGGSYGGSSSGDSTGSPIVFVVALVFFFGFAMVLGFIARRKVQQHRQKIDNELNVASARDAAWGNREKLEQYAAGIFKRYQQDWSTFNLTSMKTYMTPEYYAHVELMMAALKLAERQNQVDLLTVTSDGIEEVVDSSDNNQDYFKIKLSATANDIINDTRTNQMLHSQMVDANEIYNFKRTGDSWLLNGIDQSTAALGLKEADIMGFAKQNNMYYSLDWGWLLLPQRGQLFGKGKFGVSDINNHVIGNYSGLVVQIYTYIADPSNNSADNYVIAQVSVPKTYGNILVQKKQGMLSNFFGAKTKGLTKLQTEWGAFNDKYEVYASDLERATSFELLTPSYMEQLEATGYDINVEVVDNVIYLFTKDRSVKYDSLLELLKTAFKEMKL
jgi:preprotein translocase subunit SecG